MLSQHQWITEWLGSVHRETDVDALLQDQGGHEGDRATHQHKRKRRSSSSNSGLRQHKATEMPTTPPPSNEAVQGQLPHRPHMSLSPSPSSSSEAEGSNDGDTRGSVSPKKKRRVGEITADEDMDKTPTASSMGLTSISCRCRPILAPKPKTCDRSASPVDSVSSLQKLQKPVHAVDLENKSKELLPEDIYDLYHNIRQRMNSGFVPAPVKEEFLRARGGDADKVKDAWFFKPELQAGETEGEQKATLLAQLNKLVSIQLVSAESARLGRNEPAWNCKVHQPLLDLVCGNPGQISGSFGRIRAENISAATITGDCIPRIRSETTADEDSIPACSITASSTSSNGDDVFHPDPFLLADSLVHTRCGSEKVDFALVVSPSEEAPLRLAIDRALEGLENRALAASESRYNTPIPSESINPTAYWPLLQDPMAVAIETKTSSAPEDPLIQLGFMVAAIHRRFATLSSPGRPLLVRLIPTIPTISVVEHTWTLRFAVDRRNRIVSLPST